MRDIPEGLSISNEEREKYKNQEPRKNEYGANRHVRFTINGSESILVLEQFNNEPNVWRVAIGHKEDPGYTWPVGTETIDEMLKSEAKSGKRFDEISKVRQMLEASSGTKNTIARQAA